MDDAVASFVNVTGADPQEAQAYLASANGDLQQAVATFFAASEGGADDEAIEDDMDDDLEPPAPAPPAAAAAPASNRPRVATLGSLGAGRDDDDEDPDKPRNLFAGGERSGLNVQDPNAGKKEDDTLVKDLLKQARECVRPPPS
jgi:UBX domain-containing protein 1